MTYCIIVFTVAVLTVYDRQSHRCITASFRIILRSNVNEHAATTAAAAEDYKKTRVNKRASVVMSILLSQPNQPIDRPIAGLIVHGGHIIGLSERRRVVS